MICDPLGHLLNFVEPNILNLQWSKSDISIIITHELAQNGLFISALYNNTMQNKNIYRRVWFWYLRGKWVCIFLYRNESHIMITIYTLNKKSSTQTGFIFCPIYRTPLGLLLKHSPLDFFTNPSSLWQLKRKKYNIYLCSLGFKPVTSWFLNLNFTHCSIMTSGY